MKIVFMGTPQFAVPSLVSLAEAGHEIVGVFTRIDKPAGRGRAVSAPPVKQAALERGLPVFQPKRIREVSSLDTLRSLAPEMIVVAAYGQILPKEVLTLPRYGCVNVHASLLPAYRGAAPINWAIIRGDRETGITIMRMDEGMDTGDIFLQRSIPIEPEDTAGTLTGKLSQLGAQTVREALPLIAAGTLTAGKQDGTKATLAPLLKKEDGLVDWALPAVDVHNRVRGFTPWPGAYTFLEGGMVKLIETRPVPGSAAPGLITADDNGITVGTGSGQLHIVTIQPAGKRPMSSAEFVRGHRSIHGKKFERH